MSKVNGEKYRDAPPRVLERVLTAPYDTNADGCRLWRGDTGVRGGYGRISYREGGRAIQLIVHRLVYVKLVGDPGDDIEVDHLCHDPLVCTVPPPGCSHRRCYDLDHLKAVTGRENLLRSGSPFAINAAKTRCDYDHELAGDNLIIFPDGGRGCRECQRRLGRQSRERHRDETNAKNRVATVAAHLAREHRCKVCGADIHHRAAWAKFCELCTTDKPTRRAARLRAPSGGHLF